MSAPTFFGHPLSKRELLLARAVYARALTDAQVCDAAESERRARRVYPFPAVEQGKTTASTALDEQMGLVTPSVPASTGARGRPSSAPRTVEAL